MYHNLYSSDPAWPQPYHVKRSLGRNVGSMKTKGGVNWIFPNRNYFQRNKGYDYYLVGKYSGPIHPQIVQIEIILQVSWEKRKYAVIVHRTDHFLVVHNVLLFCRSSTRLLL